MRGIESMTPGEIGLRARPRHSVTGRRAVRRPFVVATAFAASTLAVYGWLMVGPPPRLEVTLERSAADRWLVGDVPVGGTAWLAGVRPGMTVEGWTPRGDAPWRAWSSLLLSDESVHLTIQRQLPGLPAAPALLGLLALFAAVVGRALGLAAGWWLLLVPPIAAVILGSDQLAHELQLIVLLGPPAVGALSVVEPERRLHRLAPVAGVASVALAATVWLLAMVLQFASFSTPRALAVAVGIGLVALGMTAVIRDALRCARARLARDGASQTVSTLVAALSDEITPGRERSRLAAIERERASIASDLHAEILPDLAAIIRTVDAGMVSADASDRLRAVAADLRELMTERRLSVLDELGLVRALEWLAERVEERSDVVVEVELRGDDLTRLPREVELAAFRIAQQSLDNALVHARPSRIRLAVDLGADHLVLAVVDDGCGIDPEAMRGALRAGRLGLADMRARAATIGGAFTTMNRPGGGTEAALRWPA